MRISIEGYSNTTYDLDAVRNFVVSIGGKYYAKDSDLVVQIDVTNGKKRWYRRASKLIEKDAFGDYQLKRNLKEVEINGVVKKISVFETRSYTICISGRDYFIDDVVMIEGIWFPKDSPDIVKTINGTYCLIEDAFMLHPKFYGKNAWTKSGAGITLDQSSGGKKQYYIFCEDSVRYMSNKDASIGNTHSRAIDEYIEAIYGCDYHLFNGAIYDFQKASTVPVLNDKYSRSNFVEVDIFGQHYLIHKSKERLLDEYYKWREVMSPNSLSDALAMCSGDNFLDHDETENNAKDVDISFVRPRGGHRVNDFTKFEIVSPTYHKTGGLRYMFGVELETQYGLVSGDALAKYNMASVSDGSIRAMEYVTSPMSGDKGIDILTGFADELARKTLVNNYCRMHVHVGGSNRGNKKIDNPRFNRQFSIYALKLGAMIEDELFSIQPKLNSQYERYCKKIGDYGIDINNDNWRELLGHYVFGAHYSNEYNSRHESFKWNRYRYRWMNLVNCNSRSRLNTIEFRQFSATTSAEKIYMNVLLSLAIVWFIENRRGIIHNAKAITLDEIITEAYGNSSTLSRDLMRFVTKRKDKHFK